MATALPQGFPQALVGASGFVHGLLTLELDALGDLVKTKKPQALFIPAGREALLKCNGEVIKKGLDGDSLYVKALKKQYGHSQHFF